MNPEHPPGEGLTPDDTRRKIVTEEEKLQQLLDGELLPDLSDRPEEIIDLTAADIVPEGNEDETLKDVPAIPDEGNWQEDSMGGRPPAEHDDSGNTTIEHNPMYHR